MVIISNKLLPVKGFQAINLFGILLVRRECMPLAEESLNHEKIHTSQMKELGYVFFYLIYITEWIYESFRAKNLMKGYYNISFEREAYLNQNDINYLLNKKKWSFIRYL